MGAPSFDPKEMYLEGLNYSLGVRDFLMDRFPIVRDLETRLSTFELELALFEVIPSNNVYAIQEHVHIQYTATVHTSEEVTSAQNEATLLGSGNPNYTFSTGQTATGSEYSYSFKSREDPLKITVIVLKRFEPDK